MNQIFKKVKNSVSKRFKAVESKDMHKNKNITINKMIENIPTEFGTDNL